VFSLVHVLISSTFRLVNEIGEDAVWTLSTAKAGNGVQQLRDNNMQTFWQSDGLQPHLITLEFNKQVHMISLLVFFHHLRFSLMQIVRFASAAWPSTAIFDK
jgi:hypothetical protein